MKIVLNGKEEDVAENVSVLDLLEGFKLNPAITIVELNRDILAREDYGKVVLKAEDCVELIRYMGGGRCTPAAK